jgi:hypothetical protein
VRARSSLLLLAAGELLAVGELLLEVALTIPEEQPPTAMAATPATMDMVSLRENFC